jgi:twitching motility two-component system response regulator PilH
MAINKVLVVDDSATDRLYLTEMLEKSGFSVITAESGEESLIIAEEALPDLIVMDVIMLGMTGFQATRALTKNPKTAHIPVIVCTGKSQATDQAWALKMGAKTCLAKPVNEVELMSHIEALG